MNSAGPTAPAPDLVIIGAMKSATTTLHHQLEKHPDVCTSVSKELDFFSRDNLWERGVDWYHSQFPEWTDGQLRLDSSPNYTKRHQWPHSAERLAATRPDTRVIFIVREPLSRIRSHWVHSIAAGREHREFDEVCGDFDGQIIQTTRYHWQLEPFLDAFDPAQLLVLRFDDVVGQPGPTLERVFNHAGLPPIDLAATDEVRNSSDNKTRPTELARLLRSPKVRAALRKVNPKLAERPIEKPTISDETRKKVLAYLRSDLESLQATGLVDISDWIPTA